MPRSADEHPILSLLDVVPNEEGDTTNPHVVRGPNRHHVPHPPAPRAPLEPSLEPSNTTTGASPTRDPWLDACLQALNPEAVDLGTLEKTHELIGIWRREGYDLEAQVLPVLKARTETPRAGSQRIKSWAYFREPLRTAHAQRQRQAERAKIAENSNALSSKVPFDYEKHLAWLAEWVNSGRGVPPSLINNTQRDALLAAGLVTRERLKKLQIY